jgi:hypothetical protein
MRDDNVITLKDIFESQQKGFTELRDMLADHDKRTSLLAYRQDITEKKIEENIKDITDLKNYRSHYARVAGYIVAFVGTVLTLVGFAVQNHEAIAKVIHDK